MRLGELLERYGDSVVELSWFDGGLRILYCRTLGGGRLECTRARARPWEPNVSWTAGLGELCLALPARVYARVFDAAGELVWEGEARCG